MTNEHTSTTNMGDRIDEERILRALTQADLTRKIGVYAAGEHFGDGYGVEKLRHAQENLDNDDAEPPGKTS